MSKHSTIMIMTFLMTTMMVIILSCLLNGLVTGNLLWAMTRSLRTYKGIRRMLINWTYSKKYSNKSRNNNKLTSKTYTITYNIDSIH